MFRSKPIYLASIVTLCALFIPPTAFAHISLLEPASRYPSNGNKSCPCGQGDSNRICDVPAEESSDPNRSTDGEKITVLEAGSTITIKFDEYIGHAGRFRVAFDADGADLADFNDQVLADIPDPRDSTGVREIEVTLPDITCDNCTLQLIQAMHGDTENPVADPAPLSTYYTCADIVLVPKGSLEQDAPEGEEGAMAGDPDAGMSTPQAEDDPPQAGSMPPTAEANDEANENTSDEANDLAAGPAQPTPTAGSHAGGGDQDTDTTMASNPSTGESGGGCSVGANAEANGLWALVLTGGAFLFRGRRRRSADA